MPLSPKDRERIIEEEQLRFETRQALLRENCAKCRPNRWLWWLAVAALAAAAFCAARGGSCLLGSHRGCSMHEGGFGMMEGKKCPYHMGADKDDTQPVGPGQPVPSNK